MSNNINDIIEKILVLGRNLHSDIITAKCNPMSLSKSQHYDYLNNDNLNESITEAIQTIIYEDINKENHINENESICSTLDGSLFDELYKNTLKNDFENTIQSNDLKNYKINGDLLLSQKVDKMTISTLDMHLINNLISETDQLYNIYLVEYVFPMNQSGILNTTNIEHKIISSRTVGKNRIIFNHEDSYFVIFNKENIESWSQSHIAFHVYEKEYHNSTTKLLGRGSLPLYVILQNMGAETSFKYHVKLYDVDNADSTIALLKIKISFHIKDENISKLQIKNTDINLFKEVFKEHHEVEKKPQELYSYLLIRSAIINQSLKKGYSSHINTFIRYRLLWNDSLLQSHICENTYNPQYNYSQFFPLTVTKDMLCLMKNNYIIIEIWKKCKTKDKLIGFSKIPLQLFYLSLSNKKNKIKNPVIFENTGVEILDENVIEVRGCLSLVFAIGSLVHLTQLHASQSHNLKILNRVEENKTVEHLIQFIHVNLKNIILDDDFLWAENDCFFRYNFLSSADTIVDHGKYFHIYESAPTIFLPNMTFSQTFNHYIYLSNKLPLEDYINEAFFRSSEFKDFVFKIYVTNNEEKYENKESVLIAQATLSPQLLINLIQKISFNQSEETISIPIEYVDNTSSQELFGILEIRLNYVQSLEEPLPVNSATNKEIEIQTNVEAITNLKDDVLDLSINIECAYHLPYISKDENEILPCSYVSCEVQKTGTILCTDIISDSVNPVWNFMQYIQISERDRQDKSLVFKVWHKCKNQTLGPDISVDKSIGHVVINLRRLIKDSLNGMTGIYNIIDVNDYCRGQLKLGFNQCNLNMGKSISNDEDHYLRSLKYETYDENYLDNSNHFISRDKREFSSKTILFQSLRNQINNMKLSINQLPKKLHPFVENPSSIKTHSLKTNSLDPTVSEYNSEVHPDLKEDHLYLDTLHQAKSLLANLGYKQVKDLEFKELNASSSNKDLQPIGTYCGLEDVASDIVVPVVLNEVNLTHSNKGFRSLEETEIGIPDDKREALCTPTSAPSAFDEVVTSLSDSFLSRDADAIDENINDEDIINENMDRHINEEKNIDECIIDEYIVDKDIRDENSFHKRVNYDDIIDEDIIDKEIIDKNIMDEKRLNYEDITKNNFDKDIIDKDIITKDIIEYDIHTSLIDEEIIDKDIGVLRDSSKSLQIFDEKAGGDFHHVLSKPSLTFSIGPGGDSPLFNSVHNNLQDSPLNRGNQEIKSKQQNNQVEIANTERREKENSKKRSSVLSQIAQSSKVISAKDAERLARIFALQFK